jgi:hypothetical protein
MIENEEGIRISTGEVSELSRRFVHYLARLHYARAEQLKAALERDGGWPMHVDATGEGNGIHLRKMPIHLRKMPDYLKKQRANLNYSPHTGP